MVIKKVIGIIIFTMVIFSGNSWAQQAGAWSSLDTNAIMIGDQIEYEIGITVPSNTFVEWPLLVDTLTSNIEILNRTNIDTTFIENDITLSQRLLITSFDSGYFEIPQQEFKFAFERDSIIYNTSTGTLYLQVFVPEVDTAQEFKPIAGPIKEPYTLREILTWSLIAMAVAILIALIIYIILRAKKKEPVFKRKQKPQLPPHIIAINQLEELRLAKVWQSGKLKKYYTELVDIVREYMVNRYHFDAQEMTSFEILAELKNHQINDEITGKISSVLNLSDMVKFAKALPAPLENDISLNHCIDFVNETKEVKIIDSDENQGNDGNTLNEKTDD